MNRRQLFSLFGSLVLAKPLMVMAGGSGDASASARIEALRLSDAEW